MNATDLALHIAATIDQTQSSIADVDVLNIVSDGAFVVTTRDHFPYGARKTAAWQVTVTKL